MNLIFHAARNLNDSSPDDPVSPSLADGPESKPGEIKINLEL